MPWRDGDSIGCDNNIVVSQLECGDYIVDDRRSGDTITRTATKVYEPRACRCATTILAKAESDNDLD